MQRPWPVLAVVVGLAIAACGGSGDDKTETTKFPKIPTTAFTGDPNKACKLATQSEVEAAIGTAVKPGAGANGTLCRYEVASSASQFVMIESTSSPQSPQIFDLQASSANNRENLAGAGERAFIAGNRAVVLRGSTLSTVTVSTSQSPAAVTAALRKLAQTVGSRA